MSVFLAVSAIVMLLHPFEESLHGSHVTQIQPSDWPTCIEKLGTPHSLVPMRCHQEMAVEGV